MINKYFDKIYCINLDSRPDRWEECLIEFKKIGIQNHIERFPAISLHPGIAGCTKSHYEIVKLAKKNNYKNVLIFEDDVSFTSNNFFDILEKSFSQLTNQNLVYDLLYLGGNLNPDNTINYLIDDNLAKLTYCKTTHAYAINSSVYNKFINDFKNIDWGDNNNWFHGNQNRLNIDVWLYRNFQTLGNVYGVYPCLAEQRLSFSNLLNQESYFPMKENWNKLTKQND